MFKPQMIEYLKYKDMKPDNKTTKETRTKLEKLSMFLFGYVTPIIKITIEQGEESAQNRIKRIEKLYNVLP